MAKEEEREQLNIYNIPANYSDSGRLFGGMVQTRNLIEVLIIAGILGYLELQIPFEFIIKSSIMVVTLAPIIVFGLMGVDGGSLTQFAASVIRFMFRRRKLHMRRVGYKYDPREIGEKVGRKKQRKKACRKTNQKKGSEKGKEKRKKTKKRK